MNPTSGSSLLRLRRFNLVMAALHAFQGALMLLLSNDFTLPVQTSFVRATGDGGQLEPVREVLIDMRFGPAVAASCSCPPSLTSSSGRSPTAATRSSCAAA